MSLFRGNKGDTGSSSDRQLHNTADFTGPEQITPSFGSSEGDRMQALRHSPVVLRLCHVGKSYPIAGSDDRVVALKDITLMESENGAAVEEEEVPLRARVEEEDNRSPSFGPVRRGEFVMIRGPSGGGKTTLLNIIGTIDGCTEGTIELNGREIDTHTHENVLADIRLKSLGFVFQTFNLIATMTAAENVELPMTLLGKLSNKEMRLRSRQLLTLVGLRNRINHLPSELSGGEQQRVTIARSLSNNPAMLLLDEPTGDLDTANTIEVMDLLTRINRRTKTTCIMVTHNPDIECYADRILYVHDGRFDKEVYNTVPTCLNLERYTAYLAEKERQLTGDAGEVAGAVSEMYNGGGKALQPAADGSSRKPLTKKSGTDAAMDLPETRAVSPAGRIGTAGEFHDGAGESLHASGTYSKLSANAAMSPHSQYEQTATSPPLQQAGVGRRQSVALSASASAAIPPSHAAFLAPVVHREERE